MKKLIPIIIAVFALAACEKDPDTDKLENGPFVSTDYASGTDFSSYSTFYIQDSIMEITSSSGNNSDTTYVAANLADPVLNTIIAEMKNYGYTEVSDVDSASLGLQVSFIENTFSFTSYGNPWNGNYYWGPYFWGGGWDGWYYPFPITYSYNTGSLIIDMIDLKATLTNNEMPIIWNAYISNLVGQNSFNSTQIIAGVEQAFEQSSYLNRSSQ